MRGLWLAQLRKCLFAIVILIAIGMACGVAPADRIIGVAASHACDEVAAETFIIAEGEAAVCGCEAS